MKASALLTYLNSTISINEPALNLILSQRATKVSYAKNQVIDSKDKISLQLSFIEKGNAIALSHPKPNRQVMRFWTANQFICPVGLFCNLPSTQSIVAVDDCEISALSYRQILSFLNEFPEGYAIINKIIQAEINLIELNIKSLLQNKTPLQHEAFLEALGISFDE